MRKRTITGIIMALILLPLLTIPALLETFQVVMILGVIIAVFEILKMFNKREKVTKPFAATLLISTLVIYFATAGFWLGTDSVDLASNLGEHFISIMLLVILAVLSLTVFIKDFNLNDVGKVFTTIFFVGLGSASIVILRVLGVRFIVFLLLISATTDVFAYLFGSKFGKHKMAPVISPNKSWEGAIAGALIATVVAGSFGLFYGSLFTSELFNADNYSTILDGVSNLGSLSKTTQAFIIFPIAFIGSITGQIGDLVASKLKRTYEIDDFGNLFPGHGGILDRFDSMFFVAVFLVAIITSLSKFLV